MTAYCLHCGGPLTDSEPTEVVEPHTHGYCSLLRAVGHKVGVCHCTGHLGLTRRAAALEAAARYKEGK